MLVLREKRKLLRKVSKRERTIKTAGMNKTQKALNKMGSVGSNLLVMTVGRGQAPLLPFNYKSRQSDRERLEVKK